MSRARRILILGLGVVLLFIAGLVATALLIPSERVATAVATRAGTMLGQRVTIDDVGLRFLPIPGVRLDGLAVGGTDDESALAVVSSVELRARILPLLRGDVIINSISLDRPRVLIDVDSTGRSNLPLLEADGLPDEPGGDRAARDIRFAIDRIAISNGRIGFRDARDGSVLRLDGWDQQLRIAGDVRGGELGRIELAGWVGFADVDANLPNVVVPVSDLTVRVTHDAAFDRPGDRLDLNSVEVSLADVSLQGSGTIDSVSSPTHRSAQLALEAEGIDAGALTTWMPDSLRARLALPDGRPIEPAGIAALRVDISGPLTPEGLPGFDGVLSLADGAARVDGTALAEDVRGEATFSADSVIARLAGSLLGDAFSTTVAVREPASPVMDLAFNGRADLRRLAGLGLVPDSIAVQGSVDADVRGAVSVRHPESASLAGTMVLDGIRVAGLSMPLAVSDGTVTFQGTSLRVDDLAIGSGSALQLIVTATADGWIPTLLDSTAAPARFNADVRAGAVDLDSILGPSESEYPPLLFARLQDRPLEDRRAEEVAEDAGLRLPALPNLDGEVRLRADRVVRNGLTYSDVDAAIRVRPDAIDLTSATFGFMGGAIRAAGRFEPTEVDSAGAPTRARLNAEFTLEDVAAAPFFDRLTPFRDHLAGELAMAGSIAMDLDRFALPERTSLGGDGTMALSQGRLANWEVLEAVSERLGLTAIDTVQFRDWIGAFQVTGSRIALQETALEGTLLGARAAGSFGFGGELDLGATVYLPRALAARAGRIGEQILAAAGTDDRIPVGVVIGGTAREPSVALDLSEARDAVVARARSEAEREARELAGRAGDAAMDRLQVPDSLRGLSPDSLRQVIGDSAFSLLPDSLKVEPDSLRARAEDEIRERLKNIFPGN